ncbi:MAG: hypothetical protein ACREHD_28990, partial [Pirellulales bacterium]
LKAAYRLIYRSGLRWQQILDRLRADYPSGPASHFAEFFSGSTRGIVAERRVPPATTIRLPDDFDSLDLRMKAG